jgi:glucose/sorbosone dehydrogenase
VEGRRVLRVRKGPAGPQGSTGDIGPRGLTSAQNHTLLFITNSSNRLLLRRGFVVIVFALALDCFALLASATTLPSGFVETTVASGIASPTAMAIAPNGRIFVCSQTGALRVIKNGVLLATPFVNLSVDSVGERGLLGVAFDPNFNLNHFIYLYYRGENVRCPIRCLPTLASGPQAASDQKPVWREAFNCVLTMPFYFRIFLPATRLRTARRNFSRSAGLSASSLRFSAPAMV